MLDTGAHDRRLARRKRNPWFRLWYEIERWRLRRDGTDFEPCGDCDNLMTCMGFGCARATATNHQEVES